MKCPICKQNSCSLLYSHESRWKGVSFPREFYYCSSCEFAFLKPDLVLEGHREEERYTQHQNDIHQAGYREFFNKFWKFLQPEFDKGGEILDLGCGPTPALQQFLSEKKHLKVDSYDIYFQPQRERLRDRYLFVWCQEVFEHVQNPTEFIECWAPKIEKGGLWALRTQTLPPLDEFPHWHYHRDHTHISFFTQSGLIELFCKRGFSLVRNSSEMFLFKKE